MPKCMVFVECRTDDEVEARSRLLGERKEENESVNRLRRIAGSL